MTLRDMITEYEANGFVLIDSGNGSAGEKWVEWDQAMDDEYGDITLETITDNDLGNGYEAEELRGIFGKGVGIQYASSWIEDGNGDNPYRYKVLF